MPQHHTLPESGRIETFLKTKFQEIAGFNVKDEEWIQATLPIKSHGCGLTLPGTVITAAFPAFVEETLKAVQRILGKAPHLQYFNSNKGIDEDFLALPEDAQITINEYNTLKERIIQCAQATDAKWTDARISQEKPDHKLQHFYHTFLNNFNVMSYETRIHGDDEVSKFHKARTFSNDGNIAGAWLHEIPRKGERHWDNITFRRALKLRLGASFFDRPPSCRCKARNPIIDKNVVHSFICKLCTSSIKARHDALVHDFRALCKAAALHWITPRPGTLRTPSPDDRDVIPDGAIHGLDEQPIYIDVTVGHPTCQYYLEKKGSAVTPHVTSDFREDVKVRKYKRICGLNESTFIPLAFETYGTYSNQTENLVKRLVGVAKDIHHCDFSSLLNYWRRRFSSTLQYFNAQIINESYLLNSISEDDGPMERNFYNGLCYGF